MSTSTRTRRTSRSQQSRSRSKTIRSRQAKPVAGFRWRAFAIRSPQSIRSPQLIRSSKCSSYLPTNLVAGYIKDAPGPGGRKPANSVRTPKVAAACGVLRRFVRPGVFRGEAGTGNGNREPWVGSAFAALLPLTLRRAGDGATDARAMRSLVRVPARRRARLRRICAR